MIKITQVGALDDNTIDIHLSDGSAILLNLDRYLDDPRFTSLMEDDRILYPKTDEESVFWRDGPRLPLDEILTMLR